MKQFWKSEWFWLLLILLAGAFFRFWKIQAWQHLTYDQSRDYIILERILLNHKFTLVGPTVSIAPGFFLPPFYYYSLLPFLWLSGFHIIGPDIYTAILGMASIVVFYFLAKDFFGIFPALIASFAFAINPYLVQTSRHAWNPNTLFFYSSLFLLSFEKYIFKRQRKWFLLAGFSLGWAIGLHLTAIVFLPLFLYLFYREVKEKASPLITVGGVFLFGVIFLPLVFFDFRHSFPISRAGLSYLKTQNTSSVSEASFLARIKEGAVDTIKMPVVLFSGLFQKENLTIRPSNITPFNRVRLLTVVDYLEKIKIFLALFLWLVSFIWAVLEKKGKGRIIVAFFLCGLLIRLCFPSSLFYFYYYLAVFPIAFLFLAFLLEKFQSKRQLRTLGFLAIVFLAIFSLPPQGLLVDSKPESYFLPTCEAIAVDFPKEKKVAVAGNVADTSRWEHNGLEYRYFLEAIYRLPLGDWEASDYKEADVLYFIDEGDVKDPLKFGGMEVEAFKPAKIEKKWEVETGQKIYKMTR